MLEGIEILAQNEITKSASWYVSIVAIVFILAILGLILFLLGACLNNDLLNIGGWMMCICVICVFVLNSMSGIWQEPTGRYEYKVIIGKNVSFTDIYSNYEVVGQDGKIWTIRDKYE